MRGYRMTAARPRWIGRPSARRRWCCPPSLRGRPTVAPGGPGLLRRARRGLRQDPPPARRRLRAARVRRSRHRRGTDAPAAARGAVQRRRSSAARRPARGLVARAERRENRREPGCATTAGSARGATWATTGATGSAGRSSPARALGANTPARRPSTRYALSDTRGRPLSGRHRYTLRFPPRPAARRWARSGRSPCTTTTRFLVDNPHRPLRDRRPHRRACGAARTARSRIHIWPPARRGARRRANWLPAPSGRFRLDRCASTSPSRQRSHGSAGRHRRSTALALADRLYMRRPRPAGYTRMSGPVSRADVMEEKTAREARSRRRPVRGRLRRWHAAHGSRFTDATAMVGQRPRHAAGLPRRDPRAGRHAARRLRLPDPLRLARHPHARRPPQRARGDEPGRAHHPRRAAREGRHGDRQRGRLHRPQPAQGGLRVEPARGRLARRLPALPRADDLDDRARHRGDRRHHLARRRALQEPVRARARVLDVRAPDRAHGRLGREEVRRQAARSRDANLAAFRAGYNFGETAELLAVHYEVEPAPAPPGTYRNVNGTRRWPTG